ncbi:MAG: nucleotidyltransferase domain-containing protein [Flavobacteriales bacterium]|nr:nucleotidyltransferase domain-containing protein [Flavobacteriales bacterium]
MLLARAIALRVLAYFDVFSHPLKIDEILRFADDGPQCAELIERALGELSDHGIVQQHASYWGLSDIRTKVDRRIASERRAVARMPKAHGMSRRIARFPFVRAVFISGSMSKGCLAEDGDIDFFVVTTPGRLWVTRTLLVMYKKIFLLNSRRDFCVNYFLDTEHLTVEDRNRFTATEVVTLMPMYGNGTTEAFFERNAWAFGMYPAAPQPKSREVPIGNGRTKGLMERLLGGRIGTVLDQWAMQLTWYYWKRKFSGMDVRSFEIALRTRTYVSKHHPRNFQKLVMDGYEKRMSMLEQRLGVPLS